MKDEQTELWIAACAHRLHQHWHTVHADELEAVARELWGKPELRALAPEAAAAEWLKPVEAGVSHAV